MAVGPRATWRAASSWRSHVNHSILPRFVRQNKKQTAVLLSVFMRGEGEIRTRGTGNPVRQFSKLVDSATLPPHRKPKLNFLSFKRSANIIDFCG
jgi:hypothetical protein